MCKIKQLGLAGRQRDFFEFAIDAIENRLNDILTLAASSRMEHEEVAEIRTDDGSAGIAVGSIQAVHAEQATSTFYLHIWGPAGCKQYIRFEPDQGKDLPLLNDRAYGREEVLQALKNALKEATEDVSGLNGPGCNEMEDY